MGARPRLTLALLVRDEESRIEAAIESASRFADEIVVRDTGSRDRTPEKAVQLGARVLRGAWHDDFAEARNALVGAANGDWVLMLDADETVRDGLGDLPRLMAQTDAVAYAVEIESAIGFGRQQRSWSPRLFRRKKALRYCYRAHEVLLNATPALPCPLAVAHTGFMPSRRYQKALRNLALVEADLRDRGGDPYLLWHRGRELELLGRKADADASYEAMAKLLRQMDADVLSGLEFAPEAVSDWAESLADRGEARFTVGLASRVVLAHPNRPLARFVHARALAAAGRERDAALAARQILERRTWRFGFPAENDVIETHAPALLEALGV